MLQIERHARLDGDRQRVQHGVGAAAHGHVEGEGVFERLAGEDVAGADVLLHQVDDRLAGPA